MMEEAQMRVQIVSGGFTTKRAHKIINGKKKNKKTEEVHCY